jgi:4,4'-diaponeurosporenoate glycosyltransferase
VSATAAIAALLLAAALAGGAVWRWRLGALLRDAGPVDTTGVTLPTLSVIIPARDEEHNLPALLASLAKLEPPAHQIIVVDDGSRDATAALARAAGATVVATPPLPAGWIGKAWACHTGAAHATAQWLLFTDADTAHAPWSATAALATAQARGATLLSVVPTHTLRSSWERLQGAFWLLLLIACRAGAAERAEAKRASAATSERRFSIGQYLLISAAGYRAIGGHAAIKDRLAEDLAMAAAVVDAGERFTLLYAPGLLGVRMYPEGLRAFLRGWRRSFRAGLAAAGGGGALELVAVIGWLLGVPLGLALAALDQAPGWAALAAAAYLGTAALVARGSRGLGAFPAWAALLFPLPVLAFALVSALAALDHARGKPVLWRGREIQLRATPSRGPR